MHYAYTIHMLTSNQIISISLDYWSSTDDLSWLPSGELLYSNTGGGAMLICSNIWEEVNKKIFIYIVSTGGFNKMVSCLLNNNISKVFIQ